jgi:ATP-dependent DNA helicase RecG
MDYVEEKGFGMKTFKSLHKEYGLPIPKFTFKEPFLTLTFPRTSEGVKSVIKTKGIENLSDVELGYFEIFREKRPISKSEFVEYTGLATRTAERYLKGWIDIGLLSMIGSGPSSKYQVNE